MEFNDIDYQYLCIEEHHKPQMFDQTVLRLSQNASSKKIFTGSDIGYQLGHQPCQELYENQYVVNGVDMYMGGIRTRAVTGVVICGLKPKRSECSTARILHINHCIVPNTFRFTPLLSLITVSGNGMVDRGRIIISSKVVYMVSQRALGVGSLTTSRCYPTAAVVYRSN